MLGPKLQNAAQHNSLQPRPSQHLSKYYDSRHKSVVNKVALQTTDMMVVVVRVSKVIKHWQNISLKRSMQNSRVMKNEICM